MRRKSESKKDYRQLSNVFEKWYLKKQKEIQTCKNLEYPPEEMLKRLKIAEDEYYKIYIEPYKKLSKEDLEITFRILAPELVEKFTGVNVEMDCGLNIVYDISYTRKKNALAWLLFQIDNIGLFPLSPKLDKQVVKPYNQCFYCGKPDSYKKGYEEIKFNSKVTYCHKPKCQKSSNPEKHDNCCYAKWARRRKTLEDALKKADTLYQDVQEYEDYDLSGNQEKILLTKIEKIFIDFCEKQYQENLKIDYTIQIENGEAYYLKDISL